VPTADLFGLPLTARQTQVLRYLYDYQCDHGMPPSLRHVARHFGWAGPSACLSHLAALERKGYLLSEPNSPLGRRLIGISWQPVFDDGPYGQRLKEALHAPPV
jgi:SOS-response transcriptional repressor LexA